MTKEIVTKKQNEIALDLNEEELALMVGDSEDYGHNADAEDLVMPRLKVLQDKSAECDTSEDAKYIEGAEVGDMVEIISRKVYKDTINFVPVKNVIQYLEWEGTGKQAALINNYGSDATMFLKCKEENDLDERGKVIGTSKKSRIIKTYNLYGLIVDGNDISMVVIPMSGSKAKVAKKLNTLMVSQTHTIKDKEGKIVKTIKLPAFGKVYKLKSVPESYEGNNYFNYDIEIIKDKLTINFSENGSSIYQAAKNMFDMIKDEDLSDKSYDVEDDRV